MKRRFSALLTSLGVASLLFGCKGEKASPPPVSTPPPSAAASKPASAPAPIPESRIVPGELVGEKGGIKVSELRGSPKFPAARLTQTAPAEGAPLEPGKVAFSYEVVKYELTRQTVQNPPLANSGQGQHIHFILDNGPYMAKYEPNFEVEMTEGHHVVLAFLSRSYHEALKTPGAAVVRLVTVGNPPGPAPNLDAPHLFYSRPKGSYDEAGRNMLLLDFYLVNTTLSKDGNKVRATINGQEFMLDRWVPFVIEGLEPGTLTVQLELVDAQGKLIPGPFNKVKRTVELQ